ncbi:MAG: hypothetical protein JXB62_20115 [Pirellulales bacterium]|nr:hypothetical protein [Pirellulales bacterium]
MRRRIALLLWITPGLTLALLALAADFVGLGRPGEGFGNGQIILLAVGGLAALLGFLVHHKAVRDQQRSGRAYGKTVLFVTLPAALLMLVTVLLVDRLLGLALYPIAATSGLIYPPNSTVELHTSEYRFTVETNALGIRDEEVQLDRDDRYRILAIGDSFTYGWGVGNDQAWPKVAERQLRQAGCRVEVLNLGHPGASLDLYARIARESIPLLKPDLVLVAVLQGDDLKQLDLAAHDAKLRTLAWLRALAPNLTRLGKGECFRQPLRRTAAEMRAEWQANARQALARLDDQQRQRLERLEPRVKQALLEGDVNPYSVDLGVRFPDYFAFTLHPERADVQAARRAMADHLRHIARDARRAGAQLAVVSVPCAAYLNRQTLGTLRRLGFQVDEAALGDDTPDEVIRTACDTAGVPFCSVVARFRRAAETQRLYFELDEHFNVQGQTLYGEAVSELLLRGEVGVDSGDF